jgi:hypothetical protein
MRSNGGGPQRAGAVDVAGDPARSPATPGLGRDIPVEANYHFVTLFVLCFVLSFRRLSCSSTGHGVMGPLCRRCTTVHDYVKGRDMTTDATLGSPQTGRAWAPTAK